MCLSLWTRVCLSHAHARRSYMYVRSRNGRRRRRKGGGERGEDKARHGRGLKATDPRCWRGRRRGRQMKDFLTEWRQTHSDYNPAYPLPPPRTARVHRRLFNTSQPWPGPVWNPVHDPPHEPTPQNHNGNRTNHRATGSRSWSKSESRSWSWSWDAFIFLLWWFFLTLFLSLSLSFRVLIGSSLVTWHCSDVNREVSGWAVPIFLWQSFGRGRCFPLLSPKGTVQIVSFFFLFIYFYKRIYLLS